jgi:hypothetical protein
MAVPPGAGLWCDGTAVTPPSPPPPAPAPPPLVRTCLHTFRTHKRLSESDTYNTEDRQPCVLRVGPANC